MVADVICRGVVIVLGVRRDSRVLSTDQLYELDCGVSYHYQGDHYGHSTTIDGLYRAVSVQVERRHA